MFCALVALLVLDQENARVAAQERDPLAPPPIARPREILPELDGIDEAGVASVYSDVFQGHRTASGELYDREQFTAAHKTLPFGTRVRVTHKRSGRTVEVRINDRGPHLPGRVIDLSPRAAGALGMHALGLAAVELQILETPRCATADGKRRGRRTCPSEDAPDTRPTVPRTITE